MRKYLTILSVCILILPIINIVTLKSNIENDLVDVSNDIIDKSIINQVKKQSILQNLNNLDDFFTENRGQIGNNSVRYYMQGKGVWFLDDGVVFEIREEISIDSRESRVVSRESELPFDPMARLELQEPLKYESVVLKLNFEDADRVIPEGRGLLRYRSNYFYGNDSSKWCTNVPNYQEIIYENLYDNIDLRYYITAKGLKYDFIVHPGGEINDIKLRYEGAEDLYIDTLGNLTIKSPLGDIIDSNLFIYQNIENDKVVIDGKFKIIKPLTYGFKLFNEYNKNKELIIDPLVYSTYIGGSNRDVSRGIKIDSNNNTYITGETKSTNFPNTTNVYNTINNGGYDIFVLKLNWNGSALIYSTFIGGTCWDVSRELAIDINDNVFITGETNSSDFPYTSGANDSTYNGGYDVFVLKLNWNGSALNYSTYIGGSNDDCGFSITIDSNKNTYVIGYTGSFDFPNTAGVYDDTINGSYDGFILELNPTGSTIIFSTYIGGSSSDFGNSIVIDSNSNLYVTGWTYSFDFPNTTNVYDPIYNGGSDAFVVKLNPGGSSLIFSTFIGGSNDDRSEDITLDASNNIYVTGITKSTNFPNTANAYDTSFDVGWDGFIFKLNSIGTLLIYSTFIGGSSSDWSEGIQIDANENIYITGVTQSMDFPITPNAFDITFNGWEDVFLLILNPVGSTLLYSTFIGGSMPDDGDKLVFDSTNNIYITGLTCSPDFPNTTGTFDNTFNGGDDVFVLKLNISQNDRYPLALDLNISKPSILRTNPIFLYSNAVDVEDIEKNLTPHFEYRDTNEQVWNNTYFSKPQYNKSRWEASFTPPKNAEIGLYDFKVRFNDTFGLCCKWLYLNDSLTVLNNLPSVTDLLLSENRTIQNETIFIYINGTDLDEEENNLTVELEYKNANDQTWESTYLDYPKYIINRWESNLTIPFGSPFGYYDLRTRCSDLDEGYSQWFYANDSLLIYNAHPRIIDIKLSNSSVYRTRSGYLYINCTDHETNESMLTFYGQYKSETETKWIKLTGEYSNLKNHWKFEFITNEDSILGIYNFRVRFEDNESASSSWTYLNDSLKVLNNPPMISADLDDIELGIESKIIYLSQYGYDIEDSDENLIWSVNETKEYDYLKSISIIDTINDTLKIVPLINVTGDIDIELTLTDKDNGSATKSNITIHVDSRITELIPKVTLLLPIDKGKVNTLTPKLEWSLDYSGGEIITHTVYLDENIDPETKIKSGIITTSYELEHELEDKKTYYWKVVPSGGVCLSDSFRFTVDLDFKPAYKVNLTAEKNQIMIKQGNSAEINLSVQNEGNIIDSYKIICISDKLQSLTSIDKTNVQLALGMKLYLKIGIDVPEHFELGEYSIFVSVISLSNETISDEIIINVKIVDKDFIPNYEVSISVMPESIEIEQGESENVTLTITNIGNIKDDYYISFKSDNFTLTEIKLSNNNLLLLEGTKVKITVMITSPENMTPAKYEIKFIVKSAMVSNNTFLIVNIKEKDDEIKTDDGKSIDNNTMLFVGVGIIVIIIVILVLIVLFYFYRKKKPVNEKPHPSEVVTDKPFISHNLKETKAESSIGSTQTSQTQPPPQIPQTSKTPQPLDIQNNEMKRNE